MTNQCPNCRAANKDESQACRICGSSLPGIRRPLLDDYVRHDDQEMPAPLIAAPILSHPPIGPLGLTGSADLQAMDGQSPPRGPIFGMALDAVATDIWPPAPTVTEVHEPQPAYKMLTRYRPVDIAIGLVPSLALMAIFCAGFLVIAAIRQFMPDYRYVRMGARYAALIVGGILCAYIFMIVVSMFMSNLPKW